MVTFHCDETRQRRGQTQAFRITGVDPTDQRLDQPLERLAAQPPPHERCHALVTCLPTSANQRFACHPKLAPPREDRGTKYGPDSRSPQQLKTLGNRLWTTGTYHQGAAELGIGADQLIRDPQPMTQLGGGRLVGDEHVRTAFDQVVTQSNRLDHSAQPLRRLDQLDLDPSTRLVPNPGLLAQRQRRRQAAGPAPDDQAPPCPSRVMANRHAVPPSPPIS